MIFAVHCSSAKVCNYKVLIVTRVYDITVSCESLQHAFMVIMCAYSQSARFNVRVGRNGEHVSANRVLVVEQGGRHSVVACTYV